MKREDEGSLWEQCKENRNYVTILAILAAMFLIGVVLDVMS